MSKIHFGSYYGTFYRRTQFFMREVFKELGLSFVDAIVLIFVSENPGAMQDEIANGLAIDKAAAARSLKYLEKEGLMLRIVDETNQRMKRAHVSARAKAYKAYIDEALMCWNRATLKDLSNDEQALVIDLLQKMKNRAISTDMENLISAIKEIKKGFTIAESQKCGEKSGK